ncbi:MAG: heme exporter protein CcmB [Paracoccaceae bacterium]|nr:heme exporter protein CcmB [Paracoccaceae bacterium]
MLEAFAYFKWELKLIFRTGGSLVNVVGFFTIFVLLFPIGISFDSDNLSKITPIILWISSLLSVLIALDRFFLLDEEDGTLEYISLSALPMETIILIKMISHWLTTGLPLTILSPLFALTLNLPFQSYGWLLISLLIGTPALSFIGAIGASLTLSTRRGSLLTALIVLPLYVPTLIFGIKLIELSIIGESIISAFLLLSATTLLSLVIAPFISAIAIRIHWKY